MNAYISTCNAHMVAGDMDEDHRREDEARGDVGPASDTCMLQHRTASLMYLTMYRSAERQILFY